MHGWLARPWDNFPSWLRLCLRAAVWAVTTSSWDSSSEGWTHSCLMHIVKFHSHLLKYLKFPAPLQDVSRCWETLMLRDLIFRAWCTERCIKGKWWMALAIPRVNTEEHRDVWRGEMPRCKVSASCFRDNLSQGRETCTWTGQDCQPAYL